MGQDITIKKEITNRVIFNPERIKVQPFRPSLLRAHMLNYQAAKDFPHFQGFTHFSFLAQNSLFVKPGHAAHIVQFEGTKPWDLPEKWTWNPWCTGDPKLTAFRTSFNQPSLTPLKFMTFEMNFYTKGKLDAFLT